MSAPAAFKSCPRCGLQAPLGAYSCVQCGHVYSTQFNPGQTQAFMPPGSAPQGFQAAAPRDEFEWKVQVAWLWGLSLLASFVAYGCLRALFSPGDSLPELIMAVVSPYTAVAAFGILTFCAVRLRRLYRYDAPHRTGWGVTLTVMLALLLGFVVYSEALAYNQARAEREKASERALPDGPAKGL